MQYYEQCKKLAREHNTYPFVRSQRGGPLLCNDGYIFRLERILEHRTYWLCIGYKKYKCSGRIILYGNKMMKCTLHNHARDEERITSSVIEYKDLSKDDIREFLKCKIN